MAERLQLQELLVAILGTSNVYFQPPPNTQMVYPCIVYRRDNVETEHADNKPYTHKTRYIVTVIDPSPDSAIPAMVGMLPTATFDRFYTADKLNHDVYKLFF